jgi:hypothetical protein
MAAEKRGVEVVSTPLIVRSDKKILLIKSHKWGDRYLLPGGHLDALSNALKKFINK